jgi:ParB/Sulfiredoxin domain
MAIGRRAVGSPAPAKPAAAPRSIPAPLPANTFAGSGIYPLVPPQLEPICVPVDTLKPDPQNARRHNLKKDVPKLAKLFLIHGFRKPIVVDEHGVILAGNGAWEAAKLIGMTHIPVAQSDFDDEAARIGFAVSDNKSSEYSDWDDEVLQELMATGKLNQAGTGFTDKEWNGLQLSEQLPGELETVTVSGTTKNQGEFIIIRFDTAEELSAFKNAFGMGKFERAIDYKKLGLAT